MSVFNDFVDAQLGCYPLLGVREIADHGSGDFRGWQQIDHCLGPRRSHSGLLSAPASHVQAFAMLFLGLIEDRLMLRINVRSAMTVLGVSEVDGRSIDISDPAEVGIG